MRILALLSILGLAAAGPSLSKQGDCLVDGTEAVSDAMDSAMFIWASLARCGHTGETIKCEVAITSAIESVNGMINVILKAVDKCHGLHTDHKKVGLAASKLTRAFAGVAAASGGLIQKCPSIFGGKPHGNNFGHGDAVFCTVNLKSTAKALFKAIKALMKISKKDHQGAANSLKVVEAFAHLGQYLAGALGHCTHTLDETKLGCGYYVQGLIADLAKVAEAGVHLAKEAGDDDDDADEGGAAVAPSTASKAAVEAGVTTIEIQVPRKYELFNDKKKDEDDSSFNAAQVLGMLLPVTAIVGFVGGRAFATRRQRFTEVREYMSDNE